MTTRSLAPLIGLFAGFVLAGCGGEPPDELGGFSLGMPQEEVMQRADELGGFACRLRSSRPKLTVCEGPAEEGAVTVVVEGDSAVRITLAFDPQRDEAARAVHRFVEPFGEPAWSDRPVPPRATPPEGYHTLWLDADSIRAIALVCAGQRLRPPCTAELTETTPAGVHARLDSLLNIRR